MEQHEYATGAGEAPGRTGSGRTGGAGQLTAPARAALHPAAEELARRFEEADPADAHQLFTAAFGLYGARHLGGASAAAGGPHTATSWWHGPTAHRSAALRARTVGPRRVRREAPGQRPATGSGTAGRHRKPECAPGDGPSEAAAERRSAARLLLAHPLVTADGPHGAGFPLIRRHAAWLAERFRDLLGYRLTVGPGYARLGKGPLPGRGLPGFTPAGYARLVRALAALADGATAEQALAGCVGADQALEAGASADRVLAAAEHPDVAALLGGWQVIGPDGTVDRELAVALAPQARPLPGSPELTVRRLLAETPVVLLDELAPAERDWLRERQTAEAELFADFLGLEAEIRLEGMALIDPADELTDLALPGLGTLPQAALLLIERLVEELRPLPEEAAPPAVLIPDALIDGALGDITDDHGLRAGWEPGYLADLGAFRRDALDLLRRMQLIAPAGRAWVLRAPAARYAPAAELHPEPGSGRHSRPPAHASR